MEFARHRRKQTILFVETYGNFMMTFCPSGDYVSEAENMLKTKDQKSGF
jgi:hypothetical protein